MHINISFNSKRWILLILVISTCEPFLLHHTNVCDLCMTYMLQLETSRKSFYDSCYRLIIIITAVVLLLYLLAKRFKLYFFFIFFFKSVCKQSRELLISMYHTSDFIIERDIYTFKLKWIIIIIINIPTFCYFVNNIINFVFNIYWYWGNFFHGFFGIFGHKTPNFIQNQPAYKHRTSPRHNKTCSYKFLLWNIL